MQVYSEATVQQINSLVEFLGYSLMLVLALTLAWGIKFGTVITVVDSDSQKQTPNVSLATASIETSSKFLQKTSSRLEIGDTMAVAWVGR